MGRECGEGRATHKPKHIYTVKLSVDIVDIGHGLGLEGPAVRAGNWAGGTGRLRQGDTPTACSADTKVPVPSSANRCCQASRGAAARERAGQVCAEAGGEPDLRKAVRLGRGLGFWRGRAVLPWDCMNKTESRPGSAASAGWRS